MMNNDAKTYDRLYNQYGTIMEGSDNFSEQHYKELQKNLVLYKEGNAEAVTYICKAFHFFIMKYLKFLKFNEIPYIPYETKTGITRYKIDSSISSFVSLFINKETTKGFSKAKVFSVTSINIKKQFSIYELDELYNQLILALLNMANKYKITKEGDQWHKENGTFHMYVKKCFHWEAYRFLSPLIKDPVKYYDTMQLCDQFSEEFFDPENGRNKYVCVDESSAEDFEKVINNVSRENSLNNTTHLTMKEPEGLTTYDIESINFNWTNGVTCSELFKELTSFERELIVLYYLKDKTDEEIGRIYNMHRTTICNHRRKAIQKIKLKAEESYVISK